MRARAGRGRRTRAHALELEEDFAFLRATRRRAPPSVAAVLATARTFTLDRHRRPPGPGRGRRPPRPARASRSSGCPTPPCGRRASGCGRRWSTAASSSRCSGSPSTWRRRACARRGRGSTWRSPRRCWPPPGSSSGRALARVALAGELALDGSIRPVPGALAMAEAARRRAVRRRSSCRPRTRAEAALVEGLEVVGARARSAQLPALVGGELEPARARAAAAADGGRRRARPTSPTCAASRTCATRLEVAAAGGHSLLMIGPPGAGKTLAAQPAALDPAAAGARRGAGGDADRQRLRPRLGAGCRRGGRSGRRTTRSAPPGSDRRRHAAAARRGDPRAPRRPLPRRARRVPRATRWRRCASRWRAARSRSRAPAASRSLPCRFMLVAASNPCPCGRGEADPRLHAARRSRSSATRAKLSGALADRIDILAAVRQPSAEEHRRSAPGEPSAAVRERVAAARERQERAARRRSLQRRDDAGGGARAAALDEEAAALLAGALRAPRLSGRGHDRVLRLARTIADLARRERDRAGADGARRCSCGGGTVSEPPRPAPTACAARWLLGRLAPLHREIATGAAGHALAGAAAALRTRTWSRRSAPKVADAAAGTDRGARRAAAARSELRRRAAGPAAATTPLYPGRAARRRRRARGR